MYLASMAIIGGARTVDGVMKVVKAGFAPLMKVCFFSPSFCSGNLDFRFVGDLHQLASGPNVCAEVPSIGGKAIEIGASYYFLWYDQLWVPFFNMVAFTMGVSQFDLLNQFLPYSLLFEDIL